MHIGTKNVSNTAFVTMALLIFIIGASATYVVEPQQFTNFVNSVFGIKSSTLSITGGLYSMNGTLLKTVSSNSPSPISLVVSGGSGGGACYSTADGYGWGVSIAPTFTAGTPTTITVSGSYTIMFNSQSTGIVISLSKTITATGGSGTSYVLKALSDDFPASQTIAWSGCLPGSYTVSVQPCVTVTATFSDGSTSQPVQACGTGTGTVTVNVQEQITSVGLSVTGSSQ
jgi:hypothetical protein